MTSVVVEAGAKDVKDRKDLDVAKASRGPRPAVPTLRVERSLWKEGHRWVAGIDEVGRGAWAGPLSVGVAVVHEGARVPPWLRESKALPEDRREALYPAVARWCADAAVGHASAAECDRFGMTLAWRLAAFRALAALELRPDALVVDGPHDLLRCRVADLEPGGEDGAPRLARVWPTLPEVALPERVLPLVDGDARCAAVAAASVLAKVVRDAQMRAEAEHFPAYGFERNKGYPSTRHKIALRGYGLSSIHRRSWAYVAGLPWQA